MGSRPYVQIWRTAGGRFKVHAFDGNGYRFMTPVGTFRWLWVARILGVRYARREMLNKRNMACAVMVSGVFVEEIQL